MFLTPPICKWLHWVWLCCCLDPERNGISKSKEWLYLHVLLPPELGLCRAENYFSLAIGRKWGETSFSPGEIVSNRQKWQKIREKAKSPNNLWGKCPKKLRISFLCYNMHTIFLMLISFLAPNMPSRLSNMVRGGDLSNYRLSYWNKDLFYKVVTEK